MTLMRSEPTPPTVPQLARAIGVAVVIAGIVLVTAVLPATKCNSWRSLMRWSIPYTLPQLKFICPRLSPPTRILPDLPPNGRSAPRAKWLP